MKKSNTARLILLVLVLCMLPIAAFAGTNIIEEYNPNGYDRRYVIVTTYLGSTTTNGSSTKLFEYQNPNSSAQSVQYSYSAKTSWSLSLGDRVKKSWLSGLSSDYGQVNTVNIKVNISLGSKKKLTVYKRINTTTKKWRHVCTYQYKQHGDTYWINERQATYYSTEKHNVPVLWSEITNIK